MSDTFVLPSDFKPVPVSLDKTVLAEYIETWREEPEWPLCETNVLLIIYDILLLCDVPETTMRDVLGEEGVQYICTVVDSPILKTMKDIPPWEKLPGQSFHDDQIS